MSDDARDEKVKDHEDDAELQDTASNPPVGEDDEEMDEDEQEEDLDSTRQQANEESAGDEDEESVLETDERADNTDIVDEEDDELTVKSEMGDDEASTASKSKTSIASPGASPKHKEISAKAGASGTKKSRAPSVAGLTIPFRTVKKAMKLDPDIPIVQNEAAIMTTLAAEMFLKSLSKKSHRNAKNRGRKTIVYSDIAEARSQDSTLSFLEPLLP